MPRAKLYRFFVTVQGQSDFPIDQLRYDALSPHQEADSHAIRRTLQDSHVSEPQIVRLTGIHLGDWTPNTGRWQSYGWRVTSSERKDEIK